MALCYLRTGISPLDSIGETNPISTCYWSILLNVFIALVFSRSTLPQGSYCLEPEQGDGDEAYKFHFIDDFKSTLELFEGLIRLLYVLIYI